ncbi:MAG: glucose-1-phosphate adenylyltransferase [Eggerthellaceae bacterium]|nr:glucose-1-phosphate adenylyltransferase [Eggerthellaceae bacterium]
MSKRKTSVAMILAGGQGSRLGVLTRLRAKPAVPYGGKYRIIDFPLSNCSNSGIDVVGVLTQYEPFVLNSYVGNGAPWDLNRNNGGAFMLSPHTRVGDVGRWYAGTADAIYQNIRFIDYFDPHYVVILSGDHIYKMDYSRMIRFHEKNDADATIAVMPVPIEEASRFGILATDEENRVTDFVEKPANPPSNLASMGIYVFNWAKVRQYLVDDIANEKSSHDFGKDVIPAMLNGEERLYAYRFEGYWRDVGTIDSLWEANMDLLEEDSGLDISDARWPICSRNPDLPAARVGVGATLKNCMLSEGCGVEGLVQHSVIFQGVFVGPGSEVVDSLVMADATIEAGAKIQRAVIAEGAHIEAGCVVGEAGAELAVVGPGAVIKAGAVIAPGESVEPNAVVEAKA